MRDARRRGLASIATLLTALVAGSAGGQIPADVGQVWKTYDIGPFVAAAGPESERHVVDWILQQTGYPAWHGASPASLSAADGKLSCFHTPEMQAQVADVVDRFVAEADKPHRFSVRVLGLDGPAWRAEARPSLQPIPTATPGVQAWILPRENAVAVVARLRSRSDATELPTGPVQAGNGLPAVLTGGRKQEYVQDYGVTPAAWPGWQPVARLNRSRGEFRGIAAAPEPGHHGDGVFPGKNPGLHAGGGGWDLPFGVDEHLLGALAMGARGAVGSAHR